MNIFRLALALLNVVASGRPAAGRASPCRLSAADSFGAAAAAIARPHAIAAAPRDLAPTLYGDGGIDTAVWSAYGGLGSGARLLQQDSPASKTAATHPPPVR